MDNTLLNQISTDISNPDKAKTTNLSLLLLFVISLIAAAFLLTQNQQLRFKASLPVTCPDPTVCNKAPSSATWSKPVSSHQAIPIVKDYDLYIYSLTKKELLKTGYRTDWGSGQSGRGSSDPLPSPDGRYIAFINQGDGNALYLLSSETLQATKISPSVVTYLNSWSSDSSNILYYISEDDIGLRKESDEMGANYPDWNTTETFQKNASPGFHSFNVSTGTDEYFYPLTVAESYIDSGRILVETRNPQNKNENRLVIFDTNNFQADYALIKDYDGMQWTFSQDGQYWAFTANNNPGGSAIVYAKFPQTQGTVVETGKYARIQRPYINPNGKIIAYKTSYDVIREGEFAGQYADSTKIWDASTKKIIKELKGSPMYWANPNILVIGRAVYGNNPNSFTSLDLYHLDTQEIETVAIK